VLGVGKVRRDLGREGKERVALLGWDFRFCGSVFFRHLLLRQRGLLFIVTGYLREILGENVNSVSSHSN
jgi:hypothetical protein